MNRAYLVLDSSQIPDLYPRLHQLSPLVLPHALYLTTRYAAVASCGPVLVRVEPGSELARTFNAEWQTQAGIWLETEVAETVLMAHMRSLIHVRLEGDVTGFFRFYDPRVARMWLRDLPTGERDQLMGPVRVIRLPEADGSPLLITQHTPDQPCAQYTHTPWLRFSSLQLEQLCRSKREQFDHHMVAHTLRFFPLCLQGLDALEQQQWARACQRNAARQGYSAEDEVLCWTALYAAFGDTFPDGPDHGDYRALLAERGVSPAQRLVSLINALKRHIDLRGPVL